MPTSLPTCAASRPVSTTANAEIASSTPVTTVTPSRTGSFFQIGRPSGTS